jgi:hypothetical protein
MRYLMRSSRESARALASVLVQPVCRVIREVQSGDDTGAIAVDDPVSSSSSSVLITTRSASGVMSVEKKDRLVAAIGHSPDFADNLLAACWCRTYRPAVGFRVRTA